MSGHAVLRAVFIGDARFWKAVRDPSSGLDAKGDAGADTAMKKCLGLLELLMLGMAAVIGAGIFVITGLAAKEQAGPAIVVSYVISGVACLICAVCYAEYATETTVCGGSVLFAARTFGKFAAWVVAVNILLESIISAAAVAKGFAPYFCQMINQPPDAAIISVTGVAGEPLELDLCAMGLVLLTTALLLWGVRETSAVNTATTLVCLGCIAVTIVAGFINVEPTNWTDGGFAPNGARGVLRAASQVFFAYIGFETVAVGAEEAVNPRRDVPLATVLSVAISGVLYVLMALVITGMQPYTQIDTSAPFSMAFRSVGWDWAAYVVSVGALMAIVDTVIAVQYSMSRVFVLLGRLDLLPHHLSSVHPKTQTPLLSTVLCGLISAALATIVPLDALADLVSLGTLVAFTTVCLGIVWRRLYEPGGGAGRLLWRPLVPVVALTSAAVALGVTYQLNTPYWVWILCAGVWLAATLSLYILPPVYKPSGFSVPLNPLLPSFGVLCCTLLIGTLGPVAWERWACAMAVGLLMYGAWTSVRWWTASKREAQSNGSSMRRTSSDAHVGRTSSDGGSGDTAMVLHPHTMRV